MVLKFNQKKKTSLELDVTGLKPNHIRLFKTLHNSLVTLLKTCDEREYFDASAESLRLCSALIQQAGFLEMVSEDKDIPYSEQVLEFSMEALQESISNAKVMTYDC